MRSETERIAWNRRNCIGHPHRAQATPSSVFFKSSSYTSRRLWYKYNTNNVLALYLNALDTFIFKYLSKDGKLTYESSLRLHPRRNCTQRFFLFEINVEMMFEVHGVVRPSYINVQFSQRINSSLKCFFFLLPLFPFVKRFNFVHSSDE